MIILYRVAMGRKTISWRTRLIWWVSAALCLCMIIILLWVDHSIWVLNFCVLWPIDKGRMSLGIEVSGICYLIFFNLYLVYFKAPSFIVTEASVGNHTCYERYKLNLIFNLWLVEEMEFSPYLKVKNHQAQRSACSAFRSIFLGKIKSSHWCIFTHLLNLNYGIIYEFL